MQEKLLPEHWQEAKAIIQKARERGKPEFPTGLQTLDEFTGGIGRGEVWVISGKTGGGKTSLALQIARNCAEDPTHSILFLSLEMKGWELALRMYCEMMKQPFSELIMGRKEIDPMLSKTFEDYIGNIDFELIEHGYNFDEVKKIIKTHYGSSKPPDVIFIDFIQLIDYHEFGDQRLALVSYVRDLKELANRMGVSFVVVSQIRRLPSGADYNRPPDLQDLMGSGSIEQTADKVIFLYREVKEVKNAEDITRWMLHLAKNRQGRIVKIELLFKGENYRFDELY